MRTVKPPIALSPNTASVFTTGITPYPVPARPEGRGRRPSYEADRDVGSLGP